MREMGMGRGENMPTGHQNHSICCAQGTPTPGTRVNPCSTNGREPLFRAEPICMQENHRHFGPCDNGTAPQSTASLNGKNPGALPQLQRHAHLHPGLCARGVPDRIQPPRPPPSPPVGRAVSMSHVPAHLSLSLGEMSPLPRMSLSPSICLIPTYPSHINFKCHLV